MKLESAQNNRLTVSLPLAERFVGDCDSGVVHGGVVSSILDTSCTLAVMLKFGRLIRVSTLDMRIDYLRRVAPQNTLYSRSSCYRLTEQMAFVRGTAFTVDADGNEDKVAKANATFQVIQLQRVPV